MNITTKYDLGHKTNVQVDEFIRHHYTGRQKTVPGIIDVIHVDAQGISYRVRHEEGHMWRKEGEITA